MGTSTSIFDWTKLSSTGFRTGYYNETTGTYSNSTKWLCTNSRTYLFSAYDLIWLVPPAGYKVFVTEYTSTTFVNIYGSSANDKELIIPIDPVHNYGISIGRFNNDADDHNTSEFVNQFKCYLISTNRRTSKYRGSIYNLGYTNLLTQCMDTGWYQMSALVTSTIGGLPDDYPVGIGGFLEVYGFKLDESAASQYGISRRWLKLHTLTGQSWIAFVNNTDETTTWNRIGAVSDYEAFKGKKLSILGDSISSMSGYVPEGNQTYYTGSNQGVTSVNQMWWRILCNELGMTPLVIDAWSGSGVCYNYATDASHSDTVKIPMCSDLRTGRLGTDSETPDVIIVAGGTNDWTYSKSTTTPIGDWDGKTSVDRSKVVSGTSTFMESYASLIQQLQTNYPDAIIVCASCFFTCRGTDLGCTHVNDTGHPTSDYNDAIEKVCKIMGVPYLSIYDVGFNFNNYYPTYAEDSSTIATHPNAIGHRVIAKRLIDRLPGLVKQFYS